MPGKAETPRFGDGATSDEALLLCPRCGQGYLHHGRVRVLERLYGEDGDGIAVAVRHLKVRMQPLEESELPGRRNAVEISFSCENCSEVLDGFAQAEDLVLQILQHKGNTFVSWVQVEQA